MTARTQEEIRKFLDNRNAMLRSMLPEDREPIFAIEEAAGKAAGHQGIAKSESLSDWHECTCRWDSLRYHDGSEWAYQDWLKHLLEEGVEIVYPE